MKISLFETEELEDNVEPIITLRDGTQLIVVSLADNSKLYKLVKQPDGVIAMIPYHIATTLPEYTDFYTLSKK